MLSRSKNTIAHRLKIKWYTDDTEEDEILTDKKICENLFNLRFLCAIFD
jgi:hypothetical protein